MTFLRLRTLAVTLLGATLLGSAAAPGLADDGSHAKEPEKSTWAVTPGGQSGGTERTAFHYTLQPGTVLRDVVVVSNPGRRPVRIDLYAADAYLTQGDASYTVRQVDEPRTGVGAWVTFGHRSRFTIRPGRGIQVPFELRVPHNAEAGDHAGAIMAAAVRTEKGGGDDALGVDVRRRVGSRIYLRVDGPVEPGLEVDRLSVSSKPDLVPFVGGDGSAKVSYAITNTGNIRTTPTGELNLLDMFGNSVGHARVAVPELLPGSTFEGEVVLDRLPARGRLSVRMEVTSEEADAAATATVWSVPWVPALVLVALAGGVWLRRRLRRRGGGGPRARRSDPTPVDDSPASAPSGSATLVSRVALCLGSTVLAGALVGLSSGAALAGEPSPGILLDTSSAQVGATVRVSGAGWREGDMVDVSLCGQHGRTSLDCGYATAQQVGVAANGSFSLPIMLSPPPTPCPCVVVARSGSARAAAPLRLRGHPVRRTKAPASAHITVTEIRVEKDSSVGSIFGAAAEPRLVLSYENTGKAAAVPVLDVSWSRGAGLPHVVTPPVLGRIGPGETAEVEVPLRLDALAFGQHEVVGSIDVDGTRELFTVTTGVTPWGLPMVAALLVGGGLPLWWWRVHTRHHPGQIPHADEEDVEPGGYLEGVLSGSGAR